jgi:hypothetical protein
MFNIFDDFEAALYLPLTPPVQCGFFEERRTAELIVEKEPWKPTPEYWYNPDEIIGIPVEYKEKEIRAKVKSAGGKWNPNRKMWELPYRKICELKLTGRVKPP